MHVSPLQKSRRALNWARLDLLPLLRVGILSSVSRFRRPRQSRSPARGPAVFCSAVFALGLSLAPLCACWCESASAHETGGHDHEGHSHGEGHGSDHGHGPDESHGAGEPTSEHSCDCDCIHLTATPVGQLPSLSLSSRFGTESAIMVDAGFDSGFHPTAPRTVARHHPDRGPPIPLPLFSILRP